MRQKIGTQNVMVTFKPVVADVGDIGYDILVDNVVVGHYSPHENSLFIESESSVKALLLIVSRHFRTKPFLV